MDRELYSDATICCHAGEEQPAAEHAVIPPIFMTSLHTFDTIEEHLNYKPDSGQFIYARCSNPTTALLEEKINALEKGQGCLCFASGMAAISTAILSCVKKNGHIVAVQNTYGPAHAFMTDYLKEKMNVETTYVRGDDPAQFEKAVRENTDLFYLESPSSVVLSLQDIPAVAQIAKAHGIKTVIDNSWATPLYQKPLTMGIDIVVHTMSKYIGGHSDIVGGAAVFADAEAKEGARAIERELLGGILGPFESWLCIRGLRTLPARLALHQHNAGIIADRLYNHPKVKKLFWPGHPGFEQYELAKKQMSGFTGLMSIIPEGDFEAACRFCNALKIFRLGCSWGGFESLAIMPLGGATDEAAAEMGGARNLVRLYIGQEDAEDLWKDLEQALSVI